MSSPCGSSDVQVILVAGGTGRRFGGAVPMQFQLLGIKLGTGVPMDTYFQYAGLGGTDLGSLAKGAFEGWVWHADWPISAWYASRYMAAGLLERALRNGETIDWKAEFEEPLRYGVDTFRAFVTTWYDGRLQDIFFHQPQTPRVHRMICSVLAGYAWDKENLYTGPDALRRLGTDYVDLYQVHSWDRDTPVAPDAERVPEFPRQIELPTTEAVQADKLNARATRPEVLEVAIEARLNNIDLELAKNNLLPILNAEAEPSRKPGEFVLGLGYRFGVEMRIPFLQRRARGEVLEAQGKADRFVLVQKFREQQVVVDVDNALSAVERAKQRIAASFQSLQLARTLEEC